MSRTHAYTPRPWLFAAICLVLMAALLGAALLGVVHFDSWDEMWHSTIFLNLRLPRVVLSVLAGIALATSGAVYQALFRNPLTDPYVLGVSSGASLGASLAILIGLETYLFGIGLSALATALLTLAIIYRIASIGNRLHTSTLLLTGVCITYLISAIVSFLMVLHQDKMDRIIFWTMGSFAASNWNQVLLVLPIIAIGIGVILFHLRELNLMLTGSESAQTLGVDVERVKRVLILTTTLMVAFTVSVSGVIGFVGLVVPHCVRLLTGPDNRRVIPYSIVGGGLFLLTCDTLARSILQPSELPVGSITALVGAPFFIYLLYRNKRSL